MVQGGGGGTSDPSATYYMVFVAAGNPPFTSSLEAVPFVPYIPETVLGLQLEA